MRWGAVVALAAAMLLQIAAILPASGAQGRRVALVVGNTAYQSTTALPNAASDARLVGDFLAKQGFEVETVTDVTRADFGRAMSRLADRIQPGDTALFYYAGHGMQLKGENFLLGVDARLQNEFDVAAETLALNDIIATIESEAGVSMIFVDACRNNPLADRLARAAKGATRGGPVQGLAPVDSTGEGTMIAFSASPGQVAYDGGGANSPFAEAVVRHIAEPQVEVATAFKRVIRDVRTRTDNQQSPQIVSNLAAEIYLGEPVEPGQEGVVLASATTDAAAAGATATRRLLIEKPGVGTDSKPAFAKAERIGTMRGWQLFLAAHPDSDRVADARRRLAAFDFNDPALSPIEREEKLALSPEERKLVQGKLIALGMLSGKVDGNFGKATRNALKEHQVTLGLDETGFVTPTQARALGIVLSPTGPDDIDPISAPLARQYVPSDLEGLEPDPRILKATECLAGKEIVYGEFADSLFVVVREDAIGWLDAQKAAQKCGGHLAVVSSQAEDEFVHALFSRDERFFESGWNGKEIYRQGAWIGLRQSEDGEEPSGGWSWVTGEALIYRNWTGGEPDNYGPDEDFAMYFGYEEAADPVLVRTTGWDDMPADVTCRSYVIEFE